MEKRNLRLVTNDDLRLVTNDDLIQLRDKFERERKAKKPKIDIAEQTLREVLGTKLSDKLKEPVYGESAIERFDREQREMNGEENRITLKSYMTKLSREDIIHRTFEKFESTQENFQIFQILSAWNPDKRAGFLLWGNPGTGKTHLLKALAQKWVSRHYSVLFRPIASMLDTFRANFDNLDMVMSEYKMVDLLLLDDFGAEKSTDFSEDKICQILDYRIRNAKTTFATSNISPASIGKKYHPRILDRLKEQMVFYQMSGESYRVKKQRELMENVGCFEGQKIYR